VRDRDSPGARRSVAWEERDSKESSLDPPKPDVSHPYSWSEGTGTVRLAIYSHVFAATVALSPSQRTCIPEMIEARVMSCR
jgi:hypothetical protein